MTTPHKACTKCGKEKPLDEYHKDKRARDGRRASCGECIRAYRAANREKAIERDRAYNAANREKINERNRAYKEANREKIRERNRAYRAANREKIRERNRAYRAANREKAIERDRAYKEANREKVREYHREYREENRDFRNRDTSRRTKEMNALTRLTATRNGQPWEQWEDDFIAAHPEMTVYQLATHIGRTYVSTKERKARLRRKGALSQ